MIELRNVSKDFHGIQAAAHVTASIREGMIFGLIGSNGAGKSTLLRMISGIIRPDEGEVLIDEAPVFENPDAKSLICFLPDSPYAFVNADIRQMRDYYSLVYPAFNRKQFDSLIRKFNLDPKRKVNSFSKGMKKQLSVLLGLCAGTKYLLCDETFDGLDPVVRQAVKSLFASEIMNRDFTPVISSHNLRELEDICDAVGLLHEGQVFEIVHIADVLGADALGVHARAVDGNVVVFVLHRPAQALGLKGVKFIAADGFHLRVEHIVLSGCGQAQHPLR